MSDKNTGDIWDLYDPNWEAVFDGHRAAHNTLLEQPDDESDTKEETLAFHLDAMKKAHTAQFKNAQEYAHFMLDSLKRMAVAYNLAWVTFDTSSLKTKEDADGLYVQLSEFYEQQKAQRFRSLPTDDKSPIFVNDTTRSHHKCLPGWYGFVIDTIVTVEQDKDMLNVCLTHLKENRGTSVVNAMEDIATNLFATSLHKYQSDPTRVNWYVHIPATETSGQESFMKADMAFSSEIGYLGADFQRLEKVPSAVKLAKFNASKEELELKSTRELDNKGGYLLLKGGPS